MLNPLSDHDWRLLATRLSYSTDQVQDWALKKDPCLSMLDQWFSKHKTREATTAVLTILQEINRNDAAMIVENALKHAGHCNICVVYLP